MPRLRLRVYRDPGQAEVFLNIKLKNGGFERLAAIIDTGAQTSLLPARLFDDVEIAEDAPRDIHIEQAGLARQSFSAVGADVTVYLEDVAGNRSEEFTPRCGSPASSWR